MAWSVHYMALRGGHSSATLETMACAPNEAPVGRKRSASPRSPAWSSASLDPKGLAQVLRNTLGWKELTPRGLAKRHLQGHPMPPRHGGGGGRVFYLREEVEAFVQRELERTAGRLSAAAAAHELGVEVKTLRGWSEEHPPFGPPRHKEGRFVFYLHEEVMAFAKGPRRRVGSWLTRFSNIPPSQRQSKRDQGSD